VNDDTATGRLIWHVAMRWRAAVDRTVAPVGLTHAQYSLLGSLYALSQRGAQPSQRELAEFAHLEPIYVSKLVRSMATAGLLIRTEDPTDSRAYRLSLTARGTDVITEAVGLVHALQHELTAPIGGPADPRNRRLIATLKALLGAEPGTIDRSNTMTTTPTLTGQDIAEAQGALTTLLSRVLTGSGLSNTEYVTLRVVAVRGPWESHAALGDFLASQPQLELDRQAASDLLDGLIRKGLITGDGPVALTPAGSELFDRAGEAVRENTIRLYAGMDEHDLAVAHTVLATVTERARQAS
jgi:DNA-binding MarR family transcriptional regulator